MNGAQRHEGGGLPSLTIVFLNFNRREQLRTSLRKMLFEADYDRSLIDVIVVDNASEDGSQAMVEEEFPQVQLIKREVNCGVSGWNDGFAAARGDFVAALDDDAYLPGDSLRKGAEAAAAREADLVSFGIVALDDPGYRFDAQYRTGLLSFWGCAVMIRRTVLEDLGGYDPEIFVWANELEMMMRFFDRGYRHLHMPETLAVHMKTPSKDWTAFFGSHAYRVNAKNFAYIAAKHLKPRDALESLLALVSTNLRDAARIKPSSIRAVLSTLRGFVNGLRHRDPVRNPEVSRAYRQNFHTFASPWWMSRPIGELVRATPAELTRAAFGPAESNGAAPPGRREEYYSARARYYPKTTDTLQF
jgi:GT2 family glycosyltransferase